MLRIVSYILFLGTGIVSTFFIVNFLGFDILHFFQPKESVVDLNAGIVETTPEYLELQEEIDALKVEIEKLTLQIQSGQEPKKETKEISPFFKENDISIIETDNNGVFGFYNLPFTYRTYYGPENALFMVIDDSYKSIQNKLTPLLSFYEKNITDTFFDNSFFLNIKNEKEKDTFVRFMFEYNDQTIGVQVSQNSYYKLKDLLSE